MRTCLTCGAQFAAPSQNIKRGFGKYCSRMCHQVTRRKSAAPRDELGFVHTCQWCGVVFHDKGSDRVYCSPACRHEGIRRIRRYTCQTCGETFDAYPRRAETRRGGPFCSLRCAGEHISKTQRGPAHPGWKGGITQIKYPREYYRIRKSIVERDGRRCQVCGISRRGLVVHHIDEDITNNHPCNLVTVCPRCHRGPIHGRHEITFDHERKPVSAKVGEGYCEERARQ